MRNIINIETFFKDPNKAKEEQLKKKEEEDKASLIQLKSELIQEAAEKTLEKMMTKYEEMLDPDKNKKRLFKEPLKVRALSSLPSHPNDITISEKDCNDEQEIEKFF